MVPRLFSRRLGALLIALYTLGAVGLAQLRVATWNISAYDGGRTADIQTAVYGVYSGRSLAPDVIIGQEFTSNGVSAFRNALNTASRLAPLR